MDWVAPLVIVGAVLFSAGAFGLCMSLPKLGDMLADWIHRSKK